MYSRGRHSLCSALLNRIVNTTGLRAALWRCSLGAEFPLLADGSPRPKAEVHGVICPDVIEYFVIPASPQSAAAAGLNVFSDIRNCLGR